LSKAADGQFRFALKGDQGQALLLSELYRAKDSAQGGIGSVQKNCGSDGHYEKKVAANGKFFFNLRAANNQVIGTSPMYATEQDRDAAIAAVKASGGTAAVRDSA
jgi:uncharacterized protein YegP (UPF0339 family)